MGPHYPSNADLARQIDAIAEDLRHFKRESSEDRADLRRGIEKLTGALSDHTLSQTNRNIRVGAVSTILVVMLLARALGIQVTDLMAYAGKFNREDIVTLILIAGYALAEIFNWRLPKKN